MNLVLKPIRVGGHVTLSLHDEAGERLPGQREVVFNKVFNDIGEVTIKFVIDGKRIRFELAEVDEKA